MVQVLAEAVNNGALIGDIAYLNKYESMRQWHNIPTMLAIDALHRLYKGTAPPIVLARSLGLQLTNAIKPLKVSFKKNQALTIRDTHFYALTLILMFLFSEIFNAPCCRSRNFTKIVMEH